MLKGANSYFLISAALEQCVKLQDRFTIIDVPNTNGDPFKDATEFRTALNGVEPATTYGAAYYPFLLTTIPYQGGGCGPERDLDYSGRCSRLACRPHSRKSGW